MCKTVMTRVVSRECPGKDGVNLLRDYALEV